MPQEVLYGLLFPEPWDGVLVADRETLDRFSNELRLARKIAQKKTRFLAGWNAGKYYHGDLMERSMCLLLGLTGNWGKKGTGPVEWSVGLFDGPFIYYAKQAPGQEETRGLLQDLAGITRALKGEDPTRTDEMVAIEMAIREARHGDVVLTDQRFYFLCYRDESVAQAVGGQAMARQFGLLGVLVGAALGGTGAQRLQQELEAALHDLEGKLT